MDESSSLTATDCDVSGNAVTIGPLGGGIAVFGTPAAPATLTVNQSTLEQNTAYQNGGGIALATPY